MVCLSHDNFVLSFSQNCFHRIYILHCVYQTCLYYHCLFLFFIFWNCYPCNLNPLSANRTKWWNLLKQFVGNLPTNCLSVFNHFVKLALKGLKLESHLQIYCCYLLQNESPLEVMKNTFYFMSKALFVLEIFSFFYLTFWYCRKNGLIRELTLTSNFMTS